MSAWVRTRLGPVATYEAASHRRRRHDVARIAEVRGRAESYGNFQVKFLKVSPKFLKLPSHFLLFYETYGNFTPIVAIYDDHLII